MRRRSSRRLVQVLVPEPVGTDLRRLLVPTSGTVGKELLAAVFVDADRAVNDSLGQEGYGYGSGSGVGSGGRTSGFRVGPCGSPRAMQIVPAPTACPWRWGRRGGNTEETSLSVPNGGPRRDGDLGRPRLVSAVHWPKSRRAVRRRRRSVWAARRQQHSRPSKQAMGVVSASSAASVVWRTAPQGTWLPHDISKTEPRTPRTQCRPAL